MNIGDIMKKASELQTNIARDVYPDGGRLECKICGYGRPFSMEDAAEYLAHGWPEHCGVTMRQTGK